MRAKTFKVAGIDPSLTGTGVVILDEKREVVNSRLIKSKPTEGTIPELNRIKHICLEATTLVTGCDLVVMEGLAFMAHNTTALVQLSALNYFIRDVLHFSNIPFVIVAPSTLKKFVTGKGNAKKDSMYLETYKRFGVSFTDDNLCDAYGLAAIGHAMSKPKEKLPDFQQEVVTLLKKQL